MDIYILRHGIAVEHGSPGVAKDSDRELTPKGERRLGQVADAMEVMELSFDLILSSPFVRARQTAEIIAEAMGAKKKLELSSDLVPDGSMKKLIESLNKLDPTPKSVLLVGHEPYLSGLISLLVFGEEISAVTMKKGGLCKLTAGPLKNGRCATLEWLLTPRQLASLS